MSEPKDSSANLQATARTRRAAVALVAAAALFGAVGTLSLTACKQEGGQEMSSPSSADIPHGCSPATTPCP